MPSAAPPRFGHRRCSACRTCRVASSFRTGEDAESLDVGVPHQALHRSASLSRITGWRGDRVSGIVPLATLSA